MMTRSLSFGGILLVRLTQQSAAQTSPPARAHHTIFYDEALHCVLVTERGIDGVVGPPGPGQR